LPPASHDLLQPLHAARLFSAALGRDLSGSAREVLGKLDRSIQSAEALLRSLLDISKLDAGGISPNAQPLQIRPLLAALVETMRPLALEKGLDIRLGPGDATVETDPGLLRSIVQNFLSNAIRYTPGGRHRCRRAAQGQPCPNRCHRYRPRHRGREVQRHFPRV
jgi:signal transduction histidine kinase